MKINFNTETLQPMIEWLMNYKKTGQKDKEKLIEILNMPDYMVEFSRYSLDSLPVCGISFDEALDFFMNFDKKDFNNPRLQYKKPLFLKFFQSIESNIKRIEMFTSLKKEDINLIERLLENGLPQSVLKNKSEFNIILIVSIGNSMGWPYENYIDYDISMLNEFENKMDFIHVTAHEIHHILFADLLGPDGIKSEDFFLQNFAYEGLAVHFNNNQPTLFKEKKYDDIVYCMCDDDMAFYEQHFEEIFEMIRNDYNTCKSLDLDQVTELVSNHYEKFNFMGKDIQQYPTYYFGCYIFGLIDLKLGKEVLFDAIANPEKLVPLYNSLAEEKFQL